MEVYQDLFTGKELFSNGFKIEEVEGAMYKVWTTYKYFLDNQYYDADTPESKDPMAQSVIQLTHCNNLAIMEPKPKKGDFVKKILKKYIRKLKKKLESEEKEDFVKKGQGYVPKLLEQYKELDLILTPVGDSGDEGMIAFMGYEGGITPYVLFWKHGCVKKKY